MAKNPTPQQAVEAARRAHDERLHAVRALAEARQNVVDVRESSARDVEAAKAKAAADIAAAELADVKAWDAALRAGWQGPELRRIGFTEADKRARVRRRRASNATTTSPTPDAVDGRSSSPTPGRGRVHEAAPEPAGTPEPNPMGAHHD